jgi:hypothetical protein
MSILVCFDERSFTMTKLAHHELLADGDGNKLRGEPCWGKSPAAEAAMRGRTAAHSQRYADKHR